LLRDLGETAGEQLLEVGRPVAHQQEAHVPLRSVSPPAASAVSAGRRSGSPSWPAVALTKRQAEELLIESASVMRSRDDRVRAAFVAGVSKSEIFRLTHIARTTMTGSSRRPETAR
jgi:hypothetical protein